MPPANKYLQLLDQGLAAFVYQRDENGKPVLTDNPLMLGPWRDDLEDYLYEYDSKFIYHFSRKERYWTQRVV